MLWIKLGAVVAVIAAAVFYHEYDRHRAYSEGQMAERLIWQEQQRKAEAQAEADRKAKQAAIDALKANSDKEIASLKTANAQLISQAEQKAAEDEKADGTSCHCAPAVSKRVRDDLAKIGHR